MARGRDLENHRTMIKARATQGRRLAAKIAKSSRNIILLRIVDILQMNTITREILSTVSEDETSSTKPRTDCLDRGLLIKKGEFVFVKNESPEDWIARVERVCGTKRKLYVRWMREDGQEIVMDDEFDWLSVDTIQDLVRPRPRVNSSSIGERWMRQIATNPASLAPVRDEHAPLQTGSAENRKLESTEPIFRLTSSSACEIAGTAWYWLENLEGDAQPVPGLTTKIKLAPLQLRAPRRWNLPPLWEVLGCYRHHPLR